MKNEVTQDDIFAMVQQFRKRIGEGKGKGKNGACWNCGEMSTTAEVARMTNQTTAEQMVVHGRFRKAAKQAKTQANDATQARAIGTAGKQQRQRKRLARKWQVPGTARPKQAD